MLITWGLTCLQFKHISQQPRPETRLLCLKNCVKSSERLGGEQQPNSQLLQMGTALLKPTEEQWLISEENLAYCLYWLISAGKLQGQVLNASVSFTLLCAKLTETSEPCRTFQVSHHHSNKHCQISSVLLLLYHMQRTAVSASASAFTQTAFQQ